MRTKWIPDRDEEDNVVGWVGVAEDVTDRRRAEQEMRQLQFAVQNSTDFIGLCDLSGVPFFVNTSALKTVGLESMAELQRLSVKDFFFPEDQAFITDDFLPRVLREGHGRVEIRFRHFKSGEAIWMNYNVVTLMENGSPSGFATISQNITGRKWAEAWMRENEERNRTLIESLPQLIWTCTADGQCDYLSPQWIRYTGVPEEEQLGSGWTRLVHPDDLPRVKEVWARSVESGEDYKCEFRLQGVAAPGRRVLGSRRYCPDFIT
jgi:PAS domain S-box-containing protein